MSDAQLLLASTDFCSSALSLQHSDAPNLGQGGGFGAHSIVASCARCEAFLGTATAVNCESDHTADSALAVGAEAANSLRLYKCFVSADRRSETPVAGVAKGRASTVCSTVCGITCRGICDNIFASYQVDCLLGSQVLEAAQRKNQHRFLVYGG